MGNGHSNGEFHMILRCDQQYHTFFPKGNLKANKVPFYENDHLLQIIFKDKINHCKL